MARLTPHALRLNHLEPRILDMPRSPGRADRLPLPWG